MPKGPIGRTSSRRRQVTTIKIRSSGNTRPSRGIKRKGMDSSGEKNKEEEDTRSLIEKAKDSLTNLVKDLTSVERFIRLLYQPTDPSSLAVTRILFGFLMFFDIPEERGLSEADIRWGDPDECRFPLFDFLQPLPLHLMCMVYLVMWIGSVGIALGAYFKLSCLAFVIPYWYILLLDKTAWNNHSYLYGVLGILLLVSDAHYYWSVDAWRGKVPNNSHIPIINYVTFRFQLFLLYFHAGIKKTEFDWISGYSMPNLAKHWVFNIFKPFLTTDEIDRYIVHGFAFILDLTIGFFIYFDTTRPISFIFLISFHLMNSQMFYIGMFPFVCLVTMPLFCRYYWPKAILSKLKLQNPEAVEPIPNPDCVYPEEEKIGNITRKKFAAAMFILYASIQSFMPYSHFITKGYNNWTNGLYGYSWDMMVHSWDTSLATIKVVNQETNETIFVDPEAWVRSNRWLRHADMLVQYSKCIKRHLEDKDNVKDISIYIDVWVSLNGRIHQRMFDPYTDLLKAEWSPFSEVKWVMPLIDRYTSMRPRLSEIKKEVLGWSNAADVLFMADFKGYTFQNYVHADLTNVTIENLDGTITVEIDGGETYDLTPGKRVKLPAGRFHIVRTISRKYSAFMYTFFNNSKLFEERPDPGKFSPGFFEDFYFKIDNILTSIGLVSNGFLRTFYSVPMVRRVKILERDRNNL